MSHQYRKKPVIIEAFQMTPERRSSNAEWPDWMHRAWNLHPAASGSLHPTVPGDGLGTLSITTLEGEMLVSWGDWIICGVKGELYPCKPDIFEATYEPVEAEEAMAGPAVGNDQPKQALRRYKALLRIRDTGASAIGEILAANRNEARRIAQEVWGETHHVVAVPLAPGEPPEVTP